MNRESNPAECYGEERRTQSDRRLQPTSVWAAFPPAGRRMRNRRADEHKLPYFVDRFSAMMSAAVLMLAVASILDAFFTMRIIDAGGSEINPIMGRLLDRGLFAFFMGKYVLTVAGIPLLMIFKNYYLFGTRFRVAYLFPVLLTLYAVLISYQIALLCDI